MSIRLILDRVRASNARIRTQAETAFPFSDAGVSSVTFLNHYSLSLGLSESVPFHEFDFIFADGGLLARQLSVKYGEQITRLSFDLSSIAEQWIGYALLNSHRVLFIGGTVEEAGHFAQWLIHRFGADCREMVQVVDGFGGVTPEAIYETLDRSIRYLIVFGMGTPMQERYALALARRMRQGCVGGLVTTCGGFISQTAGARNRGGRFYPAYIDALGLRWLYRIFSQKHVLARVLKVYPRGIWMVHQA